MPSRDEKFRNGLPIGYLGKIEYLIKWKGYAELENTWEPAENLQCFGMIAEFEERYKSEPTFYHSKYKKSSAKVIFLIVLYSIMLYHYVIPLCNVSKIT